jgi:hypothetical protein
MNRFIKNNQKTVICQRINGQDWDFLPVIKRRPVYIHTYSFVGFTDRLGEFDAYYLFSGVDKFTIILNN